MTVLCGALPGTHWAICCAQDLMTTLGSSVYLYSFLHTLYVVHNHMLESLLCVHYEYC